METKRMTIKVRRNIGRGVKPEVEGVDGKTYLFRFGWLMDKDDSYPGEEAWIAADPSYPHTAPVWIASGDLIEPTEENDGQDQDLGGHHRPG